MSSRSDPGMTASCSCDSVELEAVGAPITRSCATATMARKAPVKSKRYRMHVLFELPTRGPRSRTRVRKRLGTRANQDIPLTFSDAEETQEAAELGGTR